MVMKSRVVRVVLYAINGTGLGHITRQRNIGRDMREILNILGIEHSIQVLTTSDAPQIANEFLVTKLPSKSIVKQRGNISTSEYGGQARLFIGNFLAANQPHVLVVDTDPRGSFGEIPLWTSYAQQMAFVDRMKDASVVKSPSYKSTLKLFNTTVVPEDVVDPDIIPRGAHIVGKIQGFVPERCLTRMEARAELGIAEHERLLYVSAGGGGDATCQSSLNQLIDSIAALPNVVVLAGFGPLYQGSLYHRRRNVISTQSADVVRYFAGCDGAVSAAGYNTHEELLAACCPTLFYAQTKGLDRQDLRIEDTAAHGWGGLLQSWDPYQTESDGTALQLEIQTFLNETAPEIRRNLLKRPLPEGNALAAAKILTPVLAKGPFNVEDAALVVDSVARGIIARRADRRAAMFS